jgi:hypothetical protein
MQNIIDSKRYDTSTAELVHICDNGRDPTDGAYRAKALYRTAEGLWFMHYRGGSMIESLTDAERIVPISPRFASAFLTEQGATEAFEKHFPNDDIRA